MLPHTHVGRVTIYWQVRTGRCRRRKFPCVRQLSRPDCRHRLAPQQCARLELLRLGTRRTGVATCWDDRHGRAAADRSASGATTTSGSPTRRWRTTRCASRRERSPLVGFRVANTALGAISFLALEAIGGAIALSYGFTNAVWAILVVGLIIFLTGLPISYYAARYGVDMDLLTRGAGFGYIGSTITSLIYASFTFIFFALEAAIMALALELYFGLPLAGRLPRQRAGGHPARDARHHLISRLQLWTQPIWIVLLLLPFVCIACKQLAALRRLDRRSPARTATGAASTFCLFGARGDGGVLAGRADRRAGRLPALPAARRRSRTGVAGGRRCCCAGPGWIVLGAAEDARRLLPRLPRASARDLPRRRRSSRRRCTWSASATCFARPPRRWR